jgi:hypothetical protein
MDKAKKILQVGMLNAVTETLENMAFMEVLAGSENSDTQLSRAVMSAGLLVNDPVQWEIKLHMPKTLLLKIAEAVYPMLQEETSDNLLNDLLAEILNTIAGLFLGEILPQDQTFTLGLPETGLETTIFETPLMEWRFSADKEHFSLTAIGDMNSFCKLLPNG